MQSTISGCFVGLKEVSINQRHRVLIGNGVEFHDENCVGYGKCGSVADDDVSDKPPSLAATLLTCLSDGCRPLPGHYRN